MYVNVVSGGDSLKAVTVCIPRSFLVTNACNQGKTLCSPCITYIFMHVNVFSGGDSLKAVAVCISRSFLVINVCNQGKTLCSSCILKHLKTIDF
jgi:hypothetical protein